MGYQIPMSIALCLNRREAHSTAGPMESDLDPQSLTEKLQPACPSEDVLEALVDLHRFQSPQWLFQDAQQKWSRCMHIAASHVCTAISDHTNMQAPTSDGSHSMAARVWSKSRTTCIDGGSLPPCREEIWLNRIQLQQCRTRNEMRVTHVIARSSACRANFCCFLS